MLLRFRSARCAGDIYVSGIAGIVHFDGAPLEPALIEKMASAMAKSDPDGIISNRGF